MHGICASTPRDIEEFFDIQVGFGCGGTAQGECFVGKSGMQGISVGLCVNSYRSNARVLASTNNAHCNFASDRKSTRLNSSHVAISYAVFCLKQKNTTFKISHLLTICYV